jgi:hypothetical protein
VADLTKPLSAVPLYFPQIADGGGYITTIVLLNTSNSVETGKLSIFDDNGTPLSVTRAGSAADSSFTYSIQSGGIFRFQTDGSPAGTHAGSVQLTPDPTTSTPAGAGIFSFSQGGILVTESGVPSAAPTTHARIFVDTTGGHDTGVAIMAVGNTGAGVSLRAFQNDGTTPAGSSLGPLALNTNGHKAAFVEQLISWLPADFTGVLDISSSTPFAAVTLRSLTNSRGNFLLTTFPIADLTRPAPSPIVFPQIADGGGYMTQVILLSAGGASSATLSFYGESGIPLAVGR